MKDFLITNYKFNKGVVGSGYIQIFEDDFRIDRLISVINQTKGIVLYATGSPTLKFDSIIDNKVFFGIDTSSMDNTDVLQVVYNSSNALAVIAENTDENIAQLRQLNRILYNNANAHYAETNAQRVYITGTGAAVSVVVQGSTALPTPVSSFLGLTYEGYIWNHFGYLSNISYRLLRNNII